MGLASQKQGDHLLTISIIDYSLNILVMDCVEYLSYRLFAVYFSYWPFYEYLSYWLFVECIIKPFQPMLMSAVISDGLTSCLQWQ